MNKCTACTSNATISLSYTKAKYCSKHFKIIIEKRVRKDIRTLQSLDLSKEYYIESKDKVKRRLALRLLNSIFDSRLKLTHNKGLKINLKFLEEEITDLFHSFLENEKKKREINLFRTICVEDFNLLTNQNLQKEEYLDPLLASLEKVQGNSLFALAQTLRKINKKNNK